MYSSCPSGYSNPPQFPNYEIKKCDFWTCPTYGTSDYFNMCGTSNAHPLINSLGYQLPKSGDGCLGALFVSITGGSGFDGYSGIMWWEYIQGQFTQPLVSNHTYSISFYVSLAEYSDLYIKEFGAYMSQNPITSPNSAALTVTPQIKFTNPNYFKDTINWTLVSGSFIASGGENYITIGNFNNDMTTDTLRRYEAEIPPLVTYFFIDNVAGYDVTNSDTVNSNNCDEIIPNVFTPNNDSVNDVLAFKICDQIIRTTIYNRWGNVIFATDKINYYWDGKTTSGEQCLDGNYFYVIETEEKKYKGFVQLVR